MSAKATNNFYNTRLSYLCQYSAPREPWGWGAERWGPVADEWVAAGGDELCAGLFGEDLALRFNEVLLGCLQRCGDAAVAEVQTGRLLAELRGGCRGKGFAAAFCAAASQ